MAPVAPPLATPLSTAHIYILAFFILVSLNATCDVAITLLLWVNWSGETHKNMILCKYLYNLATYHHHYPINVTV